MGIINTGLMGCEWWRRNVYMGQFCAIITFDANAANQTWTNNSWLCDVFIYVYMYYFIYIYM